VVKKKEREKLNRTTTTQGENEQRRRGKRPFLYHIFLHFPLRKRERKRPSFSPARGERT